MDLKVFNLLIVICSTISLASTECPRPEKIYPCQCILQPSYEPDLICAGHQVKNLTHILVNKLSEDYKWFRQLIINDTSIESITSGTFGNSFFRYVFITNNAKLTRIDANSFFSNTVSNLELTNSPNFTSSEQLFSLTNYLKPKSQILIKNLGIEEISDYAFETNDNIYSIIITDNPIKRIGKLAFSQLPNLQSLILKNNKISEIDSNGLSFELGVNVVNLQVVLDYNLLTDKSFHENWSNNKREKGSVTTISFSFDGNRVGSLPENAFKFVLLDSSLNYMSFDKNNMICDCNIKYLLTMKSQIASKLKNVLCYNRNLVDILELDFTEFLLCHKNFL